ncbi:MAG: GNAT family N-acetyltransferase [Anaerolineae bacterium]|nr:GNAT family N-acetyltransferase [Anaerolineae bacterium]
MQNTLIQRMYAQEEDYWRLRAFLREVFLLYDCQGLSWQVARLDYWRYFGNEHLEHYRLHDAICLWETDDGQIAAFTTPESRGSVYLQVHPGWRTLELENDMLAAAERCLPETDDSGQRHLTAWAHQTDELRICALQERGYVRGDWPEHQFRRCLADTIPDFRPAPGYTVRSMGDKSELPARAWVSWRAFHPDEPDEHYDGWDWYLDIQRCPLYRRDLDLVAVAPNGELAAFCTVWYDDVTRTGYFEPVGTSPEHQRKGLGKAIMTEGLRRLKHMGALYATVAGFSQAANALYASVMSSDFSLYERWQKTF